jgi:hypothetical protein
MNRNEMAWRAGLDAARIWAEAAPVERFTKIVTEIARHEEQAIAAGERRDPLDGMELLADVLVEVTPPGMRESDCDNYFFVGVRAGLLFAWKKRHAPMAPAELTATR